jgi:hypothetical protein
VVYQILAAAVAVQAVQEGNLQEAGMVALGLLWCDTQLLVLQAMNT